MVVSENMKKEYLDDVYAEMQHRGISRSEAANAIAHTGFLEALDKYPEAQLHYDVRDAVDEILVVAVKDLTPVNQ